MDANMGNNFITAPEDWLIGLEQQIGLPSDGRSVAARLQNVVDSIQGIKDEIKDIEKAAASQRVNVAKRHQEERNRLQAKLVDLADQNQELIKQNTELEARLDAILGERHNWQKESNSVQGELWTISEPPKIENMLSSVMMDMFSTLTMDMPQEVKTTLAEKMMNIVLKGDTNA